MQVLTKRNLYNSQVASNYNLDPYAILQTSLEAAVDQLKTYHRDKHINTLVDVAVGTGNSFVMTQKWFDVQNYIGNDISSDMLKVAQHKFPRMTQMCRNAADVHQYLSDDYMDVMYMHFVMSYVKDYREMLFNAKPLLRDDGLLSIVTSTGQSLPELQHLISTYLPSTHARTHSEYGVPVSRQQLESDLQAQGFEVVASDSVTIEMVYNNFREFWAYAYKAGWHIKHKIPLAPEPVNWLFFRLFIGFLQIKYSAFRFPMKVTTDIAIVLARKTSS